MQITESKTFVRVLLISYLIYENINPKLLHNRIGWFGLINMIPTLRNTQTVW